MKEERDFIQDITEIRSMMERSSKFLSLSGWSGIMAGLYALAGAFIVYNYYEYNPDQIVYDSGSLSPVLPDIILLAVMVLIMAVGTAVFHSYRKAQSKGENVWNSTSRRLLVNMAVPLLAGGILILLLVSKGLAGLMAPLTLIFYGLAIYNASKFTYSEIKFMGLIQIVLGLISCWYIQYSLLIWAIGFGVIHIFYGIYLYFKFER